METMGENRDELTGDAGDLASVRLPEDNDEPTGGDGRDLGALRQLQNLDPLAGEGGNLGALRPIENHDMLAGAGGNVGALRLLQLQDRRLQAAAFFMAGGSCVILYGTVLNPSVNPDHVLAGFGMFTTGAGLAILTLGGARTGRIAARLLEEALRAFF